MSQCVPSWDVDEHPPPPRLSLRSNSNSTAPDVPMLDYDVAELTWENGQLSMHGLGLPRVPTKPSTTTVTPTPTPTKDAWEKPRGCGTLESIVNQATCLPHRGKSLFFGTTGGGGSNDGGVYGNLLVPWLDPHRAATIAAAAAASNGIAMDALVPSSNHPEEQRTQVMDSSIPNGGFGTCMVGAPTRVGSCSGTAARQEEGVLISAAAKRARVEAHVPGSGRDQSVSGSATFGRHSQHVTLDTSYDKEFGLGGFTSTSMGSPENTRTTTVDDRDSVSHSRPMRGEEDKNRENRKSSVSTKRSRAAAIHNQSERELKAENAIHNDNSVSIEHSQYLLEELLPHLKQLSQEEMTEKEIETIKLGLSPSKLSITSPDDLDGVRLLSDNSKTSIFALHKHCQSCSCDFCLASCHDFRDAQLRGGTDPIESHVTSKLGVRKWPRGCKRPRSDRHDRVCCDKFLELKSLYPPNNIADLVDEAGKLLNKHKHHRCMYADETHENLHSCLTRKASSREHSSDNYLYCPEAKNLHPYDFLLFQWHWRNGEPVIVRYRLTWRYT